MLFITFGLLLLSGGLHGTGTTMIASAAVCNNAFPDFEIPDALEKVNGSLAFWSLKDSEYFRDYRVKSDTKQFTINCTSRYPVQFRVTLTKPYENATFAFYSTPTVSKSWSDGTIKHGSCFRASITFLEVNENLSGLYACESFVTHDGKLDIYPEYRPLGIFIYATNNDVSPNGTMLNRGQNFTVKPEEDRSQLVNSKFSLYLPCSFNTPSLLKTEISYVSEGQEKSFDASTKVCSDNRNLCMDFDKLPPGHSAAAIFQHGARVTCNSTNSVNELDAVLLNILPLSDFKHDPDEREMILEVQEGEVYTFLCESSRPVRLTTNYQHGHQISTNSWSLNHDTHYQAKLDIVIPDADTVSDVEWYDDYKRTRKDLFLNVSCFEENPSPHKTLARHDWMYTLIFTSHWDEDRDDLAHSPLEYNRILRQSRFPNQLMCRTASPKTMKVYFVPCSTITDCQMKAPLLSDSDYIDEWVNYERHSVRFSLEPGISGMVRCVGFQRDIMSYLYVGFEEYGFHSILSSTGDTGEFVTNPLVFLNATEISEGETIEANCTSPLMTMMSDSSFGFQLRNGTVTFIPEEYILEQRSVTENERYVLFATILIPTIDVIGVSCTNMQFIRVSPVVWKKGILLENAENYSLRVKVEKAFLNVTARPLEKSLPGDKDGIYVGIAFAILFLIGVITTIHFYLRFQAQKRFLERLSAEEIECFRNGCPEFISENENANTNAQHLPFLPKYEIDPTALEINFKEKLGAGEFGVVYKGLLKLDEEATVAVKSLKPGATGSQLRSAMAELKVMIFIGFHENIVKIIGACTYELENQQLYVVMEFCENRSLFGHLRDNSEFFFNQVQRGVYDHNLQDDGCYTFFLKTSDLIRWSYQIANGMTYISGLNVIHGDLASRNVLLDKNFTAKISDFGLSRKLYELPAYTRKKTVPVPWRWCALESLVLQKFSLATDVWSFGVTLWEIFSLGESPYPGLDFGNQFITMLTNNFRMGIPTYSSCEIYNIMMECWQKEPAKRPNFVELRERLEVMNSLKTATDVITEETIHNPLADYRELKIRVSIDPNPSGSPSTQSQLQYSRMSNTIPV